jgi:hypothetical protein
MPVSKLITSGNVTDNDSLGTDLPVSKLITSGNVTDNDSLGTEQS